MGVTGIIPALAGNTVDRFPEAPGSPDHPRSRGEYVMGRSMPRSRFGSSPLSRGILLLLGGDLLTDRIIPALAGNTSMAMVGDIRKPDHPRSRGEYRRQVVGETAPQGSSPLSRGIPTPAVARPTRAGIIPALAGNTRSPELTGLVTRDHPRSRGEYHGEPEKKGKSMGSSPLSRGIPKDDLPSL